MPKINEKIIKIHGNLVIQLSEIPGCGDSGCIINKPKNGQHTNGGCRCKNFERVLNYYRNFVFNVMKEVANANKQKK